MKLFNTLLNLAKNIKSVLQLAKDYTDEKFQVQTGNGTKTSAVASVERCVYVRMGNIVTFTATFTTASSGVGNTTTFFTGLPKPRNYGLRFTATNINDRTTYRLFLGTDGSLANAYTSGTIANRGVEFTITYIADSFVGGGTN